MGACLIVKKVLNMKPIAHKSRLRAVGEMELRSHIENCIARWGGIRSWDSVAPASIRRGRPAHSSHLLRRQATRGSSRSKARPERRTSRSAGPILEGLPRVVTQSDHPNSSMICANPPSSTIAAAISFWNQNRSRSGPSRHVTFSRITRKGNTVTKHRRSSPPANNLA
jgi:hypothetical protein